MRQVTVVVASEPRVYRDALTQAIRCLRPELDVVCIDADGFDVTVARLAPNIVVANRLPLVLADPLVAWVALYPGGLHRVVVRVRDDSTVTPDLEFAALLAIIDRATAVVTARWDNPRRRPAGRVPSTG